MNTARILVLIIALGAGGVAAYLASGFENKSQSTEPTAVLQTVDVLVAKSDIGLGQSVSPENLQWQSWPASTASNSFIRRNERPEATTQIAGWIARAPFIAGEPRRWPARARPARWRWRCAASATSIWLKTELTSSLRSEAKASTWFATACPARRRHRSD